MMSIRRLFNRKQLIIGNVEKKTSDGEIVLKAIVITDCNSIKDGMILLIR